jgi:uncharacterized protein YcgI (DUF1989 family)
MMTHPQANVPPAPAYFPTHADSPLHPPKELYERLRNLKEEEMVKKQDFIIPPRSGRAWKVPSGSIFRLSTPEGAQVRHISSHDRSGVDKSGVDKGDGRWDGRRNADRKFTGWRFEYLERT